MSVKQTDKSRTRPPEWLVARVRGEFFEMPGLRLTCEQACRLWQVDVSMCKKLLDHLVLEGLYARRIVGFMSRLKPGADATDRTDWREPPCCWPDMSRVRP